MVFLFFFFSFLVFILFLVHVGLKVIILDNTLGKKSVFRDGAYYFFGELSWNGFPKWN